jgi:hypothetical protein
VAATRAHKAFCLSLSAEFPGYTDAIWGITASDSQKGYVAWGGPPRHDAIDGSVVPAAAGGSLMFTPDIAVPALREMQRVFGNRAYGRYGFADAFHPTNGWVNPDVIGINLGITLLSAETCDRARLDVVHEESGNYPAPIALRSPQALSPHGLTWRRRPARRGVHAAARRGRRARRSRLDPPCQAESA